VVDKSEPAHLGAHRFEGSSTESVPERDRLQRREKLALSPLQFHKHGNENALMIPVAWKQNRGEFIQSLNPHNLVMIQIDLGTWQHASPRARALRDD
jgi:hypothetical protein